MNGAHRYLTQECEIPFVWFTTLSCRRFDCTAIECGSSIKKLWELRTSRHIN